MSKIVYVVGGDRSVVSMFKDTGWIPLTDKVVGGIWTDYRIPLTDKVVDGIWTDYGVPDLVCFTGGADVSPELYGEKNTGQSFTDPKRDEFEVAVYKQFVGKVIGKSDHGEDIVLPGVPMVGICRGGQFLNVMNGGKMIQHIPGHSGDREIFLHTHVPRPLTVREEHHQGIDSRGKGSVLAVDMYDDNEEIVWFPETRCLCFQPHPEWGHEPTKELFFDLIEELIG